MAQFNGVVKMVRQLNIVDSAKNGSAKSFLTLKNSAFQFFPSLDVSQFCKPGDEIIIITTEIKRDSPKAIGPSQIINLNVAQKRKTRHAINFSK